MGVIYVYIYICHLGRDYNGYNTHKQLNRPNCTYSPLKLQLAYNLIQVIYNLSCGSSFISFG